MNKNYLIIGLIILALVVIGVIAARPGEDPIVDNGTDTDTPATVDTASLEVADQALAENEVVIDRIEATEDGFVAVYRTDETGEYDAAAVLGTAQVMAGVNDNVVVTLTEEVENEEMLVAVLHNDTGAAGEFEFGADNAEVDSPVTVEGVVVSEPFTVSVEETEEATDAEATEEEATNEETADEENVDAEAEADATLE